MALWKPRRRAVLAALGAGALAGGGGLWLAVGKLRRRRWARPVSRSQPFAPNVFLAIDRAGMVTIWITRSEMGQGVLTALAMLVAEELDADWTRVVVQQAPADGAHDYGSLFTAASASVRSMFIELRRAGASARQMLVAAASDRWDAYASDCQTREGAVHHGPSGRSLDYGALAEAAARARVPLRPRLKAPAEFRLIGKPVPRLDLPAKVTGKALFGADVRRPGMRHAMVARPPAWGARLQKVDDRAARAVPGVRQVLTIEGGVAVVADDSWAAQRGREALALQWDAGPHASLSDATIAATLRDRAATPGAVAHEKGDAAAALGKAGRKVEATYTLPYLAHLPMEPLNCLAEVTGGRCQVWAPTQDPDGARATAARVSGLPLASVAVYPTLLGGGFGRRTIPDEVAEAVELSRKIGAPVQVRWSREDDLRYDRFREASHHRLAGAVSGDGLPVAWFHHLCTPSIQGKRSEAGEVDDIATDGARDLPYAIPDVRVEWSSAPLPVPVGIWRGVGYSYNVFAVECFLDELAHAAGLSPVEVRWKPLQRGSPRLWHCLMRVIDVSNWLQRRKPGRAFGLAVSACFGSFIAQVAEVSLEAGRPRVHRVWCVLDCGLVVNPDIVKAQVEGGVAFGLAAALHGGVRVANGAVVQSNFHDYPLLRLSEMPEVEVHLMASAEPPGGVGEVAVPAIAPAVANALFQLEGKRRRSLPFIET